MWQAAAPRAPQRHAKTPARPARDPPPAWPRTPPAAPASQTPPTPWPAPRRRAARLWKDQGRQGRWAWRAGFTIRMGWPLMRMPRPPPARWQSVRGGFPPRDARRIRENAGPAINLLRGTRGASKIVLGQTNPPLPSRRARAGQGQQRPIATDDPPHQGGRRKRGSGQARQPPASSGSFLPPDATG